MLIVAPLLFREAKVALDRQRQVYLSSLQGMKVFAPPLSIEKEPHRQCASALPWIQVAKPAPYFATDAGEAWTPIGQNDAITWPELAGSFRHRDLQSVEAYLGRLAAHGVTCMRLMLEYSEGRHRYFERPVGRFQPAMVRLWDDLFALCEKHGLRILLTPFDTFWMWLKWKEHPYNRANGGPSERPSSLLLCPETRAAIKARLAFATERWGASGALFAWDLWNELHPAQAEGNASHFAEFIDDISGFLRALETRLHGRSHPQTISVFGPLVAQDPWVVQCVFRHPTLDFANVHFYEHGTIDHPRNTVDAAISTGRLVREALGHIQDTRPFFDSEHGPIHTFKDYYTVLPEAFDDEYFRHMQWAHFASGGAGGGMRWPNRSPHTLTAGMRAAQRALAGFLPLIDWQRFKRRNWNRDLEPSDPAIMDFGCGDEEQAIVWLLRTDRIGPNGMLRSDAEALSPRIRIPALRAGRYRVTVWDTLVGRQRAAFELTHRGGKRLPIKIPPMIADVALAIRRVEQTS